MVSRRLSATLAGALVVAGATALTPAASTTAAPPPKAEKRQDRPDLGNGLGRTLAETKSKAFGKKGGLTIDQSSLGIKDAQGRVLVQLTPQAGVDRAAFRKQAEAAGLDVQHENARLGTLEGYVTLAAAPKLAALKGTGTLAQSLRGHTRIGDATSQGVALERIDQAQRIAGADGKGITVAALSDSYDAAANSITGGKLKIHAKQDVKSGDLPGKGNKQYPQPVVVIQDAPKGSTSDFDEGRAMLQIVHDIAPAAKLCFATANGGVQNFADNIRKLADKKGPCGADVIVDDVGYFEEAFFSDNVISDAIDDVAKQGVQYFSSAGNDGEQQSWDAPVRVISAQKGVKGTNLDFTDVDPALYSGGLEDMDPGAGTDVAQDLLVGPDGGLVNVQWDDPVDVNGATFGDPLFSATGEITAAQPAPSFTWTATAADVGKQVQFRTDAIPSGTTDLILSVTDPSGKSLGTIDTGSSPEVLGTTITQAGAYTITVTGFDGDTGDFTVDVKPLISPSKTSTDFNLLLFSPEGDYLGAIADNNKITGRPQEIAEISGLPKVQLVIAKAGTGGNATRLRNIMYSDIYIGEYADPLAPAINGHSFARGGTAVAAYDPFKPYLPEYYTSPGGNLQVPFDSAGNPNKAPVRQVPQVAGTDRGNTTFFVADDLRDPDTLPNFGGTSASAPHVAGIAALVLQKHPGLSSDAMRNRLKASTFDHDLDPMHAGGSAGGLTISADGPQGNEVDVLTQMNNTRFFTVSYTGSSPVESITLDGPSGSPTSLAGMVFDPRPFGSAPPYRTNGFPFTIGDTTGGLNAGSVGASYAGAGQGESTAGQFKQMTLRFNAGLKSGQGLSFGVDRDLATSGFGGANEGNGADELGGAIFLPQGTGSPKGMRFTAKLRNGQTISGTIDNKLGQGFSPVDGYGLVNAEKAVLGR